MTIRNAIKNAAALLEGSGGIGSQGELGMKYVSAANILLEAGHDLDDELEGRVYMERPALEDHVRQFSAEREETRIKKAKKVAPKPSATPDESKVDESPENEGGAAGTPGTPAAGTPDTPGTPAACTPGTPVPSAVCTPGTPAEGTISGPQTSETGPQA